MFEELMASIWEEFVRVIFHVEVNIEPAQAEQMFGEEQRRRARRRPVLGRGGRGAPVGDARGAGRRRRRDRGASGTASGAAAAAAAAGNGDGAPTRRPWSRPRTRRSAATTPAGAARARSTRSATAPRRRGAAPAGILAAVQRVAGQAASKPDATVTISGRAYAFNHMRHVPRRGDDPVREYPELCGDDRRQRRLLARGPRRRQRHPVHRPARGLQPDRPADLPSARRADRQRQLPDAGRCRVQRARRAAQRAARPRRPPAAVRDRHHRLGPRRARRRLRHLRRAHAARRRRSDGAREAPRPANPTYFNESVIPDRTRQQTSGDGGIIWTGVPAGDLPGYHREPVDPLRQLPRHLRARPHRQRQPALGRV